MSTSRRSFIKQSVSAVSAGLLVPDIGAAMDNPDCKPPSSSDLKPNPDIHVQFSGLFVYQFRNRICDVFPLKKISGHKYKVEVFHRKGRDSYPLWQFSGEPKNHLVLSVTGAQQGVKKYAGTHNADEPIDRRSRDNDCKDWRWTLSIWEFLGLDERMPEFDLWPGVRITNGLFYTAVKTGRDLIRVARKSSTAEEDLYSIGSSGAVNIYFDSQITGATLQLGSSERPVPMPKDEGVTYEINFSYEPQNSMGATRGGTKSHFYKYYEKMKANKPRTIYDIWYYDLRSVTETGTPDVPCMGLEG